MNRRAWMGSMALCLAVIGVGAVLVVWKRASLEAAREASANQPEPMEAVTVAAAKDVEHRRTSTAIGTVKALRSITLQNELPGTVREVRLSPGEVVDEGTLLVALDVSVEEAELKALEAQATLAESTVRRMEKASQSRAASEMELDRARADRDVALAQIARTKAIIARKTIRAPFRARVGMVDLHVGQYLDAGAQITTLQGVDDAAHVEFSVAQWIAAGLSADDTVEVTAGSDVSAATARIVALDARVDPATRNAWVRARIEGAANLPKPGSSVRVKVPVGPSIRAVAIPVNALRKGPGGDHVYVVLPDGQGKARAKLRNVRSGPVLGDEVIVLEGISPGEQVAASGSFKLFDGVLVAVAGEAETAPAVSGAQ